MHGKNKDDVYDEFDRETQKDGETVTKYIERLEEIFLLQLASLNARMCVLLYGRSDTYKLNKYYCILYPKTMPVYIHNVTISLILSVYLNKIY